MIPFRWFSRDDSNPPVLKFAATARGVGAAELLRPVSDGALAELIDAALQQEIAHLVRGADELIEAALSLQPVGSVRPQSLRINRGLILTHPVVRSAAVDEIDTLSPSTARAATVYFGPDLFAEFHLSSIELERGSVKAILGVVVTGVVLPIALAASAPLAQSIYSDHLTSNEIKRVVGGTPCEVDFAAQLDLTLMRKLAITNLQKVHAKTKKEQRLRVCMLQTMMHLNGAYSGYVDGIEGHMTKEALAKFASASGLSADDTDTVAFYDALITGIQPKR